MFQLYEIRIAFPLLIRIFCRGMDPAFYHGERREGRITPKFESRGERGGPPRSPRVTIKG